MVWQARSVTSSWTIRDVRPGDIDDLRRLNVANEPEVGPLDDDRVALFTSQAASLRVVETNGGIGGLFVGLDEALDYRSPNYRWFLARHPRFAYVDRIALAPELRGAGIADTLYGDFEEWARSTGRRMVCAEVNVEPPNPRSLRFHQRRGYEIVGEVAPYGGEERVAMVEKHLEPPR